MSGGDGGRLLALDGLRGVAAFYVVALHLRGALGAYASSAYLAVDFFFVLSGFVLCHSYAARLRSGLTIRRFMMLRAVRLWPLYVCGLSAGFAIVLYLTVKGWNTDRETDLFISVAANALYMPAPPNHLFNPWSCFPFNAPAWSLFFEMVANVVFAVALRLAGRKVVFALAGAGLIAFVLSIFYLGSANFGGAYENFWPGFGRVAFSFFAGVVLYWLFGNIRERVQFPVWPLPLVLAAALMAPVALAYRPFYDAFCTIFLFPALVVAGAAAAPWGLLRRVSTIGGDLSYALYATHWAMLMAFDVVLRRLFGETTSTVNFGYQLLVVGALAGIAFVLARYFDPIARRMLRSLLERRQPAPVG